MKHSVYGRRLEDNSGFGVFQRNDSSEKWEVCLGLGATQELAWEDYRNRFAQKESDHD